MAVAPSWPPEPPQSLSDDELLRRLGALVTVSRRLESVLVAHIAEVDARRLYLREACSSMFTYCVERLGLSETEAYLRITVARASREHPPLLEMLRDGRLQLSGIGRLVGHLTPQNRNTLLAQAAHKSKREIEELVARLAPQPDAPGVIRRLPARRTPLASLVPEQVELCPDRVGVRPHVIAVGCSTAAAPSGGTSLVPEQVELCPDRVGVRSPGAGTDSDGADRQPSSVTGGGSCSCGAAAPLQPGSRRARIEALAPGRYKVQFTATAEFRDKLERLQDLIRASVPEGDLAGAIEQAVTEKLERLEARRFGSARKARGGEATNKPEGGASRRSQHAGSRHIPVAIRRAVRQRDGDRCRFVDAQGRRCTERRRLEFHHRHPVGYGGGHSIENIALLCRLCRGRHKRHYAESRIMPSVFSGTAWVKKSRALESA